MNDPPVAPRGSPLCLKPRLDGVHRVHHRVASEARHGARRHVHRQRGPLVAGRRRCHRRPRRRPRDDGGTSAIGREGALWRRRRGRRNGRVGHDATAWRRGSAGRAGGRGRRDQGGHPAGAADKQQGPRLGGVFAAQMPTPPPFLWPVARPRAARGRGGAWAAGGWLPLGCRQQTGNTGPAGPGGQVDQTGATPRRLAHPATSASTVAPGATAVVTPSALTGATPGSLTAAAAPAAAAVIATMATVTAAAATSGPRRRQHRRRPIHLAAPPT